MNSVDERVLTIGRTQYGAATRRQLLAAGISPDSIRRRLRSGRWEEVRPNVLDLGTHDRSWRGDLQRLLLSAGDDACASHWTAAHLHGFLDVDRPERPDILVRRGRHTRIQEVPLRTTEALGADEVTEVHGLRTTGKARTLYDLAPLADQEGLERWLLDLARRDRDALSMVGVLLDRYPTRHGRSALATAVGRLPADAAKLGSPLEVAGVQVFIRLGATGYRLQYRVYDHAGRLIKCVDMAFPDVRLLIEFDGRIWHDVTARRAKDEAERERLRAHGYDVEVLRREDLHGPRPRQILAQVEERRRALATG